MKLVEKIKIISRKKISDDRGFFLKVINGQEENVPNYTGEFYITVANPNEAKGGHYHNIANEWFCLIKGECEVNLYDIETCEELTIMLSEHNPCTIYIPNKVAHIFKNISNTNDYILTAYTDQLYKPLDTIPFKFN